MVERHLAKVNVASSNLVFRSKNTVPSWTVFFLETKKVRDVMGMSIGKYTGKVYLFHLAGVIASLIMTLPFINMASGSPYWFSALTAFIYLVMMYSISWNVGYKDSRCIQGFYPDRKKSLYVALWVSILPVMLYIFRLIINPAYTVSAPDVGQYFIINMDFLQGNLTFPQEVQKLFEAGSYFMLKNNLFNGIADVLYKVWFFPFEAFLGNGNLFLYALFLLVLPIIVIGGYNVGLTKFQIFATVYNKMIYQNRKNKQNKKEKQRQGTIKR